MIEELLRRFARENFDDANYVPFLYGHLGTANPLSLIIKRKRSIWKRPLAKAEIIFLGGLEKFISSDSEKDYLEAIKLIVPEKVMEKGRNDPVDSHKKMGIGIGDIGEINLTANVNLGDLQLGRVGQKYILDLDLRKILSCAVLDADKMAPYQDEELLLITSVIYSEKFEVVGKRKQEREIEAGLEPPSQFSNVLKAKLHGKYKETLTPPGVAIRNAWGPILFKYCRVQYNREQKRLEIMKGEFAGKCKLTRHMSQVKDLKCYYDPFNEDDDDEGGDDDADNDDGQVPLDVVAGDILPDDFIDEDMKNIERIYKNVLMTTKSREQQKALVKKYLGWFENLLAEDKMKILLDHREPLTSNDCKFLRCLYVAAIQDQDSLDFTKVKKTEVHGCGFILKLLDELSHEEWEELGIPSN